MWLRGEPVLEPRSMRVLHEALRPLPGQKLDQLVVTTFTLDLVSLLSIPLALSRYAEAGEDRTTDLDPLAVLASVQHLSDRITVFHQADMIAVPNRHRALLPLVEDMLVPVAAPRAGAVFHPKLWIARYSRGSASRSYRLLCLSRNLTEDRCWDTILSLQGSPAKGTRPECEPLSDFVEYLARRPRVESGRKSVLRTLARELSSVRFEPPANFERLRFCPLGINRYRHDPVSNARRVRMLIVSPFVGGDQVGKLCDGADEAILVTRPEEAGRLSGQVPSNLTSMLRLDDALEAEPEESATTPWLAGLHAKLYVADQGWNATVWSGSANATSAAFGGNVEFLVELTGKKSACGVDKILGNIDGQSFRSMLAECEPDAPAPEDDPAEQQLDALARQVAELPVRVQTAEHENGWSLSIVGDEVKLPSGVRVFVAPLIADRPPQELRAAQPINVSFHALSARELSGLFEARIQLDDRTAERRFVAYWPLVGTVPDRVHALLVELASDHDKLLAFLRMFLTGLDSTGPPTAAAAGGNVSGAWGSAAADAPILELFLRTLASEPERLDDVAKWLPELASVLNTESGAELLRIWDAVWQARTELDA